MTESVCMRKRDKERVRERVRERVKKKEWGSDKERETCMHRE